MVHSPDTTPIWTDEVKVLTREQLNIPGLHMIGHADYRAARQPLTTHYHHTMELVVTLDGKQQFIVENKRHILYGGDIFMTYPLEPHGNEGFPSNVCEYVWFQFDFSSADQFLGLSPAYSAYVFKQLSNYHNRIKKAHSKDLPVLRDAFFLLASSNLQERLMGYNQFLHFVINNLCSHTEEDTVNSPSPNIQDAVSYIHAHLTEDIPIDVLADCASLSPAHFIVKFKEQMGMTPHAYIVSMKIDTAKVLLKNPDSSVTEIAYLLNFSSGNHFANVFKKLTGSTPSDFKKNKFTL